MQCFRALRTSLLSELCEERAEPPLKELHVSSSETSEITSSSSETGSGRFGNSRSPAWSEVAETENDTVRPQERDRCRRGNRAEV